MVGGPWRVFLSSASELRRFPGGRSFLDAAAAGVVRAGDVVADMNVLVTGSLSPAEECRRQVSAADVYVGLVGFRYGMLAPGSSISFAELEFHAAGEARIPRLMFLLDESAPLPARMFTEAEPGSIERQDEFRALVRANQVTATFATVEDIEMQVLQALVDLRQQRQPVGRPRQRTVLIACSTQMRELGALLARELAPDVGVVVWPTALGVPSEGGGTGRLLSRLDEVDLALVLPGGAERQAGPPREWFEIGTIVGALGIDRTFVVTPHAIPGLGDLASLPVLFVDRQSGTHALRKVASTVRERLAILEPHVQTQPAYYSCFISYAGADKGFVERLYPDLQDAGISCWLDSTDIPVGGNWEQELHRGVAGQDKVLLVLSRHSMKSRWVQTELRLATQLEQERRHPVLFPIRTDDTVLGFDSAWARALVRNRHIGDFTGWDDEDKYRRSLRQLVRDLTISAAGAGTAP
jgi:hypothetical protein